MCWQQACELTIENDGVQGSFSQIEPEGEFVVVWRQYDGSYYLFEQKREANFNLS